MRFLSADCHNHSERSDGKASVAAMVEAGAAAALDVMVMTDHLTIPASTGIDGSWTMDPSDLPRYRDEVSATAREWAAKGGPEVVLGFECDYYPGCEEPVRELTAGAAVRLGSVHWVDHGWIDSADDLSLWEELGPDEVWRRYVALWCEACESPLAFDVMAHPDLPRRFEAEGLAPTIDLAPLHATMAECAHDCHRRVELSTAGLRKSFGDYYPSRALLEAFHGAEVPITLGSDAHAPADVGFGIAGARRHAAGVGYRTQEVPHANGEWETCLLLEP